MNGTQDWERMYKSINVKIDVNGIEGKYGTLTSEELLKDYSDDLEYEMADEVMESKANVPTEEIKFDINKK